ncbi:glycosyltransferase [Polaromonas sp.]|uniref:glycosyltransferase family 2 protein n=1 Tax=Polaromonas sp. TaxID=1869339 RepID=UPI00185A90B4|nr:glycosyltransferase [Polaromonas sp.]NML86824.1 glycosyltransferase [Polaromonas sp.]
MTVFAESIGHVQKLLISVCIVTYNQQNYIRDAVMSVLGQVNPAEFDLEILVGDDSSTDSTPAILQDLAMRHPDYMTVVTHSRNVGGCENYLTLLRRARGDFVAHLDGDDYWLPGKLSAQLAFLNDHQECTAVYSNAVVVNAQGVLVGGFSNAQPDVIDADYLLARGNFLNHSSLLYRAQSIESLGALQSPFIDYMVHLRLAQQGSLGLLPATYVVYRRMTATSMLKNQFSHFDDLYLHTIVTMAAEAPESVRHSCCATYIINTLSAQPLWCMEKDFWSRAKLLVQQLRLRPTMLLIHMALVLFSAVRKMLSVRVSRFLCRSNALIIVHPRQ